MCCVSMVDAKLRKKNIDIFQPVISHRRALPPMLCRPIPQASVTGRRFTNQIIGAHIGRFGLSDISISDSILLRSACVLVRDVGVCYQWRFLLLFYASNVGRSMESKHTTSFKILTKLYLKNNLVGPQTHSVEVLNQRKRVGEYSRLFIEGFVIVLFNSTHQLY